MAFVVKLCLLVLLCVCCEAQMRKVFFTPVPKLIKEAGYPSEKHRVTTDDGYILQMHRIPAGRRSVRRIADSVKGKKAVLLVHGLVGSSGDYVIMGPERSLSYLLADAGYDVWLANLRGTEYTSHETLKKSDDDFWKFGFHEHGIYDVPAAIDKVLNVTGLNKILYIGYSMGSTSYFVMMSERPEYNDKLIAAVVLAPAVYLDNVKPVASMLLKTVDLPEILRQRGILYVNPQFLRNLMATFCNFKTPEQDLCINIVNAVVGEDQEQCDLEMLPVYMYRFQPATAMHLQHFGKVAITGVFTKWGGSLSSPVQPYNLSGVRIPTSVLYGENDQLTEKSQVLRLAQELNSTGVLERYEPGCSWPKFNHLDFVFAKDVGALLNKPLIRHIDELYNKYGLS